MLCVCLRVSCDGDLHRADPCLCPVCAGDRHLQTFATPVGIKQVQLISEVRGHKWNFAFTIHKVWSGLLWSSG